MPNDAPARIPTSRSRAFEPSRARFIARAVFVCRLPSRFLIFLVFLPFPLGSRSLPPSTPDGPRFRFRSLAQPATVRCSDAKERLTSTHAVQSTDPSGVVEFFRLGRLTDPLLNCQTTTHEQWDSWGSASKEEVTLEAGFRCRFRVSACAVPLWFSDHC